MIQVSAIFWTFQSMESPHYLVSNTLPPSPCWAICQESSPGHCLYSLCSLPPFLGGFMIIIISTPIPLLLKVQDIMIRYLLRHRFSTSPYQLLSQHEQVYQYTSQSLKDPDFVQKIKETYSSPSVYCGYDPTAQSLHLGNLLSIIAMGRLSTIGLRPVFVVGGATAQIGDPSGKNKERPALQKPVIATNILSVSSDIDRVYTNILNTIQKQTGTGEVNRQYKIIDNTEYYDNLNILEFLNDVGRYFRLNVLLSKENIANRLNTEEGLAYSQFSYTLLQSYDYYKLFQREQCILQIGGSDQWGNITNGCDYIKKKLRAQVYGLTLPLLTTSNGVKFGKTENNALFLNPELTSKSDVYNYFYNTPDGEVEELLKLFTFVPLGELKEVMGRHKEEPHKRIAQKLLCEKIFGILYDEKVETHNQQRILRMKKEELRSLQLEELEGLIKSIPALNIKRSELVALRDLPQLFTYLNIKQSKSQVRREIQNGGVYINNEKIGVDILQRPLTGTIESELLHATYILFRFGKKNLYAVRYSLDQ